MRADDAKAKGPTSARRALSRAPSDVGSVFRGAGGRFPEGSSRRSFRVDAADEPAASRAKFLYRPLHLSPGGVAMTSALRRNASFCEGHLRDASRSAPSTPVYPRRAPPSGRKLLLGLLRSRFADSGPVGLVSKQPEAAAGAISSRVRRHGGRRRRTKCRERQKYSHVTWYLAKLVTTHEHASQRRHAASTLARSHPGSKRGLHRAVLSTRVLLTSKRGTFMMRVTVCLYTILCRFLSQQAHHGGLALFALPRGRLCAFASTVGARFVYAVARRGSEPILLRRTALLWNRGRKSRMCRQPCEPCPTRGVPPFNVAIQKTRSGAFSDKSGAASAAHRLSQAYQ